jgi:hypothetical protein
MRVAARRAAVAREIASNGWRWGSRTRLRGAIFNVPQRFSRKWVQEKLPRMDSTEFHHEAAARGWDEDELRQLA